MSATSSASITCGAIGFTGGSACAWPGARRSATRGTCRASSANSISCLEQEIKGNHHGLALSFLAALGVEDPACIAALPVTESYAESFLRCYSSADRTGDEALAALAGRELVAPGRNEIIISALSGHYGVTSGLEFFSVHTDLEAEHFRVLWEALVHDTKADPRRLIEAARVEIWEHITFWDDVYFTILEAQHQLAS